MNTEYNSAENKTKTKERKANNDIKKRKPDKLTWLSHLFNESFSHAICKAS